VALPRAAGAACARPRKLGQVCNDSFAAFKADRAQGRTADGAPARKVKPATVNRSLEVARTVLNRAAHVWRQDGRPWLSTAPLIEMLDEEATRRRPYPMSWAEQAELLLRLPAHLQRKVLFSLHCGVRRDRVRAAVGVGGAGAGGGSQRVRRPGH
jgi:hypothetical protein